MIKAELAIYYFRNKQQIYQELMVHPHCSLLQLMSLNKLDDCFLLSFEVKQVNLKELSSYS